MAQFIDRPDNCSRYVVLPRKDQAVAVLGPGGHVATIHVVGEARLVCKLAPGTSLIAADSARPRPARPEERRGLP